MSDTTFATNWLNDTLTDDDLVISGSMRKCRLVKKLKIVTNGGSTVESKFSLSGPRGFSSNLPDAISISTITPNSSHYRWRVPFGEHVGAFEIPYADILQSMDSDAAAAKALDYETGKGLAQAGSEVQRLIIGRNGGAAGYGSYTEATDSGYPTFTIRFTDGSDARNWNKGDMVTISTTDLTSAGTLVGDVGFVVERDVELGYIRVAALSDVETPANPGSWVNGTNYYAFKLGEASTSGTPEDIITSLEQYFPAAASSTTLHGVPRADDSALSGARLTTAESVGSNLSRARKLINKMVGRYHDEAEDANLVLLNSEDWGLVEEELIAKDSRQASVTTPEGYQAISVMTANGTTEFVSEPYKNKGSAFILSPSRIKLNCPQGKLINVVTVNGIAAHLMPGKNSVQVRTMSKVAVEVGAPFAHGRFSTAA